jgi:hypothetical protein
MSKYRWDEFGEIAVRQMGQVKPVAFGFANL